MEPKFQEYFVDAMALPNKSDNSRNYSRWSKGRKPRQRKTIRIDRVDAGEAGHNRCEAKCHLRQWNTARSRTAISSTHTTMPTWLKFPQQVMDWLREMDGESPYQVTRLEHSLQSATRAERDGADDETVVCALLHDIGDILAPANHSEVAAALLAPFVSEKNHWIVKHHGLFQGYYWFQFMGQDRNARDQYRRSSVLPGLCRLLRELGSAVV